MYPGPYRRALVDKSLCNYLETNLLSNCWAQLGMGYDY
jgi:hypothetical protein